MDCVTLQDGRYVLMKGGSTRYSCVVAVGISAERVVNGMQLHPAPLPRIDVVL